MVAAGLTTLVAIPLSWSIGPLVLLLAALQLAIALSMRKALHWWSVAVIIGAAAGVWAGMIAISAILFDA
jgi:hypothetical protein